MGTRCRTRIAALGVALTLSAGAAGSEALAGSAAASYAGTAASVHRSGVSAVPVSTARAKAVTGRYSGAINTYDRAAVDAAYRGEYAPGLSIPSGYGGDVGKCEVGDTSAESRGATLRAINFVRSLAGLAPVSFSDDLNTRSQYTALMMSANRQLNHNPPPSWRCYTSTGAANAARSNLALWYPGITSSGVVGMYMNEAGAANTAVGHRRWLLNPFSTTMGSGATFDSNAITVVGPSSSYQPNPRYVGWPTAGWFPTPLEPSGRWSLSAGNARTSFSRASVAVYRNGVRISAQKDPVHNGYAQPTLVWEVPDSLATAGSFHVVVKGIRIGRKARKYSYAYDVSMFSPS